MKTGSRIIPSEVAMQQAWRFRLWGTGLIMTSQGKHIRVLEAGKLNTGPGPDFKDAKISVDGSIWAGAVEIHRNASDWHRHGHEKDRAYENVVLHVVGNDDCRIRRPDGSEILQTVMQIEPGFGDMFNGLLSGPRLVLPMCGRSLHLVADIFKTDWLTALAFERMQRKADDVLQRLGSENGDWFQTAYVTLARGLGFGSNADNMERLARATPFRILLKHTDSIETVEAILFGQAGLLSDTNPADAYERNLAREYGFYKNKYGLTAPENLIWHTSARNIANTPYRRIALLARFVCERGSDIGSRLCEKPDTHFIRTFLSVALSEYWAYSFAFGRTTSSRMGTLGKQSQDLLIINVLAPLIYARALETGHHELLDGAMSVWEDTAGEFNSITRGFEAHGIKAENAFTSQALIQLHREYCERRRCPECRLGHRLLSSLVAFSS